ncbi:MAG: hypothetical protein ACRDS9_04315 [Pseudonocardiaceae bacterium]
MQRNIGAGHQRAALGRTVTPTARKPSSTASVVHLVDEPAELDRLFGAVTPIDPLQREQLPSVHHQGPLPNQAPVACRSHPSPEVSARGSIGGGPYSGE